MKRRVGIVCLHCVLADADLDRVTEPTMKAFHSSHDESLRLGAKASSAVYQYIGKCALLAILLALFLFSVLFFVSVVYVTVVLWLVMAETLLCLFINM